MHAPGSLGAEDAEEVADDLPPNSSALLVAFENAWAAKFVEACRAADAVRDRPDPHPRRSGGRRPERQLRPLTIPD